VASQSSVEFKFSPMLLKRILIVLFLTVSTVHSFSQRTVVSFNQGWTFTQKPVSDAFIYKYEDDDWQDVLLPHCWNVKDPFDDDNDYYRGICWYRKHFSLTAAQSNGKRILLRFKGVNQVADVYMNGAFVTRHQGGYTAFYADLTPYIKKEGSENLLSVKVNNAHDPYIPPLEVGYVIYGGIYRNVDMLMLDPVHFATDEFGAEGLQVHSPNIYFEKPVVTTKATVRNESSMAKKVMILHQLFDAKMKLISTMADSLEIKYGAAHVFYPANGKFNEKGILIVWSDLVRNPIAVRYGWKDYCKGELYNTSGLPASSFRTDDW